ncbi:MAG: recombinase family protein, partial [Anaerolineae bacterium]
MSRNSFEYPIMLWQLCQAGVEVISVTDNKSLKIEDQTDKLVRFIEGWQAETESKNTSIRVYHAMKALAEKGQWSGGRPPYGFRLSEKKGGLPLEINDAEAAVIKEMCRLYLEEGVGSKVIAGVLNSKGIRTREGRPWRDNRVRDVLQNPIIAGLPAFGRRTRKPGRKTLARVSGWLDLTKFVIPRDEKGNPKPVPEYAIIDLDTWYALCAKMKANHPNHEGNVHGITRSDALLSGFLVCGYCGRSLVSSSQNCQWHRSKRYMTPKKEYRCVTHIRIGNGRGFCEGQRSYSQKKIDGVFLNELRTFLATIKTDGLGSYIENRHVSHLIDAGKTVAKLEADLKKAERIRSAWVQRLDDYFASGEGLYAEEFLANKVKEYDQVVRQLKSDIEAARMQARLERERRANI